MLTKKLNIIGLLLMIILSAGNCQGQMENESINDAVPEAEPADINSSGPDGIGLSYIWSLTGIEEDGPVVMALRQENGDLYGQAKFEPDSGEAWNGLAIGRAEGDEIILVLSAQKGDVLCSSRLMGIYDPSSESISGEIFQVCDANITRRGEFQAIWINPDISSYSPAAIKPSSLAAASLTQDTNASVTGESASAAASTSPAPEPAKSRFHDVREDRDRILTGVGDISQIPIGMGGSGLP